MSKIAKNILENKDTLPSSKSSAKKRVWVGMSGGVDSSVSALLLKQAGFDVTGVFIKVWQPENGECTWKDERRDAMRVAAHLDIPFLTFDFADEYKREVVDYMIAEYKKGRTPNPDVMCNRHIKFGSYLKAARDEGVDYIATGHYAQNIFNKELNLYELREGADKSKDQSYFLWTLTQSDLQNVLFPIGHLQKTEVRAIAEKNGLPIFDKKDSQGICFLGHVDMKEFLKEYIKTEKGNVLDTEGSIIGQHDGALLYTIGERHGFTLFNSTPDAHPKYIISKDVIKNTITVAEYTEHLIADMPKTAHIDNVNVIGKSLSGDFEARLRYRQQKQACKIQNIKDGEKTKNNIFEVLFKYPQKSITPGQSLVVYNGEVCVGGGILMS